MLGWLMNLGMAGSAGVPVVAEERPRNRGASRKKQWWEDSWVLPPHKKIEELPHKPAIKQAKEELKDVRRLKAAPPSEIKRLSGQLGGIVRRANTLEARIDEATEVEEVEEQYRALQRRVSDYTVKLEGLREKKIARLRADDERFLSIIMEMD